MATIGSAKATLVDKIDSLTASATAKDTIYLAKALKENTTHHSFTYLGAWAATTAYSVDDVVITGGQTYICILSHVAPGSFVVGAHWDLLASKGIDGSNGANGTDVGTGASGQALKTNSAGTGLEWGDVSTSGGLLGIEVLSPNDVFRSANNGGGNLQVANAGGGGTWTKPAGCNNILVYVTGGGGGGWSQASSYRGGGGAAGGTAIKYINLSGVSSVAWTCGAGGNFATSGTTSSFGSYCSATGGQRGSPGSGPHNALGGIATGGDLCITGGGAGFTHSTDTEQPGGASYWTQTPPSHNPDYDTGGSIGRWGSGGGHGHYSNNNEAKYVGGAGVIVIYKYT
jgi:hypothetical protein